MLNTVIKSVAVTALAAAVMPASALNILLTNDDGYGTYGIEALRDSLVSAGHNVYISAPAGNQSGKSGGINTHYGEAVDFTEEVASREWSIDGTPADSASAGLYGLTPAVLPAGETIDLLVSGINDGENISLFANASGTVGAAVYALRRGTPAIAVSVGQDIGSLQAMGEAYKVGDMRMVYHYKLQSEANARKGADTAAALIPVVIDELGETGLADGIGLNINVPSGAFEPKGARLVKNKSELPFDLVITDDGTGGLEVGNISNDFLAAALLGTPVPESYFTPDLNSEGHAFAYGYTTISIIDGNMDASIFSSFKANWTACHLKDIADIDIFWCGRR